MTLGDVRFVRLLDRFALKWYKSVFCSCSPREPKQTEQIGAGRPKTIIYRLQTRWPCEIDFVRINWLVHIMSMSQKLLTPMSNHYHKYRICLWWISKKWNLPFLIKCLFLEISPSSCFHFRWYVCMSLRAITATLFNIELSSFGVTFFM